MKYKRECFAKDDDRFKGCDSLHGIIEWCNKHNKEIIQIIKTEGYHKHEFSYELIYRD